MRGSGAALAAGLLLAGCAGQVNPPATVPAPPAARPVPVPSTQAPRPVPKPAAPKPGTAKPALGDAVTSGVRPGPAFAGLSVTAAQATAALQAFRTSCPALLRRKDASGLTRQSDWSAACSAAAGWADADAFRFFATQFETAIVGTGTTFVTGYYEPEIAGSLTPAPGYAVPIYKKPSDLIEVDLGQFSSDLAGRHVSGHIVGSQFLPYPDRAAIDAGALAGQGLEIAYAADPVEFFFLQVQGSGRLKLPDGSVVRIGYAGQNGRPYVGIGGLMKSRGQVPPNQASMQGIMGLLRAMPDGGRATMEEDPSFVFFRLLTGPGPVGALGVAVSPRVSLAADPRFVPLGAPVWLSTDRPEVGGLWVAQDTGGAIKGANRFDSFWGAGDDARLIAGGMSARGQALLLLPVGTLARLGVSSGAAPAQP